MLKVVLNNIRPNRISCQSVKSFSSNSACFNNDSIHKYSSTVFLPSTPFGNRSDSKLIESKLKPQTTTELYEWNINRALENNDIKNLFIFHDGPPYANGDLHIGHALNKVLKDIVNRYHLLNGKKIHYKPGWDCHGLPIELKTLEKLGKERKEEEKIIKKAMKKLDKDSKEFSNLEDKLQKIKKTKLSPLDIIALSTKHAKDTQKTQSKSFQELGIMGDFENPYMTLNKSYVINQLRIFKKFFDNGLVHRQEKPVYWGCENATALAEGELEYNQQHVSKASFVKFPVSKLSKSLELKLSGFKDNLWALIWTSTPWTLASNKAISINEQFDYTILQHPVHGNLIVAQELVPQILKLDEKYETTSVSFKGSELLSSTYKSPITQLDIEYPFLHGSHVTSTAGTGLVHTAPGHGQDDYLVCLRSGIKPYSPVDQHGKYTSDLPEALSDFVGLKVLGPGNLKMLEKITDLGILVHRNDNYVHSYPYDWRSKKPIIIRATPQWFIDVSKIKEKTTKALLDNVEFYPERGSKRLISFINTRNEWCISRQRSWGVPIPVMYHKETGNALLDDKVIEQIIKVIGEEDMNSWFRNDDMTKWLSPEYKPKANDYVKGTDTMDVWFDSGSSWKVIESYLKEEGILDQAEKRGYLSNVYLEGSDQHRGWFQSSVLTKVGVSEMSSDDIVLPYKQIVTHGFTLDEKGDKMSKSLGNTIAPKDILLGNKANNIPKLGIDGLRLWVAQSDYTSDVSVGPTVLKHVGDNLKKIRFTFKFLLGNMSGWDGVPVNYAELNGLDKYMLSQLKKLMIDAKQDYEKFNYFRIVKSVNQFVNVDLSTIYFDVRKDCLYTDALYSLKRQGTLTVFQEILQSLVSILAPILPIITQEVWNNSPKHITTGFESHFKKGWYESPISKIDETIGLEFKNLFYLRNKVKALTDLAVRQDKNVCNSLETSIHVKVEPSSPFFSLLKKYEDDLADFLVVSKFNLNGKRPIEVGYEYKDEIKIDNFGEAEVIVAKSENEKCPRCWKFTRKSEDELCVRCDEVIHKH